MLKHLTRMATRFFGLPAGGAAVALPPNLSKHENFQSRFLQDERTIIVYVPPDYDDEPQRRYPVLYLQDGQNLFDAKTAFGGTEWCADETADELIESGEVEPLIIAGIYNTGERRIEEYTPSRNVKLGGGKAQLYGHMLVEELIPFINKRYRTLTGPENTGLGGSSLGGLVSLYLGLQFPQVFGKLAVLSPSVWWDNRAILKMIAAAPSRPPLKIWLDMGTSEGGMSLQDAEALRDALEDKGWREGEDLQYSEIEGAIHNEAAWAERVGPFLKYLFPAR